MLLIVKLLRVMKISFFLAIKGQKIPAPEPFEVPYLYEGNLCSVIVYGSLNKPQILVESFKEKKQLPLTSKCWFFIRISWSRVDGFKFCQYTVPKTRTSLSSNSDQKTPTSLSSTTGKLRGGDKIEISNSNNLVRIIFKAEVNQEDLDTIEPIIFLEKCSEFGIRVVDSKFSNLEAVFDGFSCANCQLVNVEFSDSQLQGVNFSNSYLNQVNFFKSNLNRAKFNNSKLTQVEFSQCNNFKEATFDNCRTIYNLEKNEILIFNNCNLNDASFKKALLCSKVESFKEKKQLPLTSKCWFFIRISWSRVDGFKFCQYTVPKTRTSLSSNSDQKTPTSLSSTTGKLRGGDKIEISNSNNLVRIIFKAEVNQEDLDTIEPIIFLEKCSEFGIRVVDSKFSNLEAVFDGFSCANCQLVNVEFSDSQLQGVNFSNSYLNQVKIFKSNLNRAKFNNCLLYTSDAADDL